MSTSTSVSVTVTIPPHDTQVVDEPWDGPAMVAMCPAERGPLRAMHAWVDSDEDPDTKQAYALPHHMMSDGRVGPANVNGVRNALARLPQSRIPESDRDGVRAHLQRHLDAFNDRRDGASEWDYPRIVRAVAETPWAILPGTLAAILDVVALRASGQRLTPEEIQARIGPRQRRPASQAQGPVAVLPLYGVLIPRATLLSDVSGATSLQQFTAELRDALNDPQVTAVVIDVDSPGGMTDLVPELASEIRGARGRKPIVAVANTTAASAAYWLAAQADELVVTPSGDVGGIGVFAAHEDISGLQEKLGVKTTLISYGRYKTEGNPFEPLTEEALGAIQERVDDRGRMFVADVARGRGVSVDQVREGFGQGRLLTARAALREGMVDAVDTLEATVARLASGRTARPAAAALSGAPPGEPAQGTEHGAAAGGLSFAREAEAARREYMRYLASHDTRGGRGR